MQNYLAKIITDEKWPLNVFQDLTDYSCWKPQSTPVRFKKRKKKKLKRAYIIQLANISQSGLVFFLNDREQKKKKSPDPFGSAF